ncbi:GNAT family N-acetyltransferase [Glacieibacterium megasporae]|uniref:GNAT family N-acetyltransferase n=1 Tax=Glacieibacterium megasporae TaxID=2835787 RepID=UPI001C1E78E0|nr:N-acetyltransferase [Polymorphobacter megasporae]UAJ10257.1 N-acetyltransferase [Polymorphobacter megasporae]
MASSITIRAERPGDAATITDIVRRAYADVSYSDHREHIMIDRLRETDAYLPSLSLLAEIGGEPVGHILLTKAAIVGGGRVVTTLALAPLSVVPEFQRRGVGTQLVGAVHERAAALDFESVLLVGIPEYYAQFGYEALGRYPIALPFEAPAENCMIFELRPGALDGVAGRVRYADGWLDH